MSDPYRQSALLLHGLNAADRHWILAQLAEDQRAQLNAFLAELEEIGMPPDRALVESVLAHGGKAEGAARGGDTASFGAGLRNADADAVLRVLGEQPSWLIAMILSMEPWAWREAVYVGVDASKRDRIKQALREKPPALLAHALVVELEARLEKSVRAPAAATGPGSDGWSALGLQIKRLVRG